MEGKVKNKDKNFLKYILNYLRWLILNNEFWKLVLPLYFIATLIWFINYHEYLLVNKLINNNKKLISHVDSMESAFKIQQNNFNLILRDIMGDYGDVIPKQPVFLGKIINTNHLSARQIFNWMFRYLFSHKPDVRDALERFYFYEQAITDSLKKHNLPLDLKYVFLAESWAYPLSVSSAGAVGGHQFMPYTAIELNVEINKDIDMRRDPWYMSKIFCDYITKLRKQANSYEEALRAYNTGINRFLLAAANQSWVTKAWFIDVNDENNIYLFWILVWKWIYERPLKFGIKVNYDFPPIEIQMVAIKLDMRYYRNNLTFLEIATAVKSDMFFIKDLNPAFLKLNRRGERVIPGPRDKRYITRYLKLPANLNIDKLKKINKRGIKFLVTKQKIKS